MQKFRVFMLRFPRFLRWRGFRLRMPRRFSSKPLLFRRRPRAYSYDKRKRVSIILLLFISVFILIYIWVDTQIRPGVIQVADARVRNLTTMAINDAILDVLSRESVGYNDLITFERDGNGEIRALLTNMAGVNTLKTEVSAEALRRVEGINLSDLAIPLGNLTNVRLLMGRGPRIGVRIVPVGALTADLENEFSSAGINQTRHQIFMSLNFHMTVLTMAQSIDVTIDSRVMIAETIIVGNVPDMYADIGRVFGA